MDESARAQFDALAAAIRKAAAAYRDTTPPPQPAIDIIALERSLNWGDLAFAFTAGGWPGFWKRYRFQAKLFCLILRAASGKHRGLVARRIRAQDAALDRIIADDAAFWFYWLLIWIQGASHFAGFPRPRAIKRTYASLRPLAYHVARVIPFAAPPRGA